MKNSTAAVPVAGDDFYLTRAEQRDLAARHPGDRCLEHRGYPGTHDVALGDRVLGALASQRTGSVAVPSYDKSAHGGRGDRASAEVLVEAPLDVVLAPLALGEEKRLTSSKGIGPKIAESVRNWFAVEPNRVLIREFADAGVLVAEERAPTAAPIALPFAGMTFVVTGTLPTFSRDDAHDFIKRHGGKVAGSVSARTDLVVAGPGAGSKAKQAAALGIRMIDEDGWLALIGDGGFGANPSVIATAMEAVRQGGAAYAKGQPCWLEGTVGDATGQPLAGAVVEIWQCDAEGHYRLSLIHISEPTRPY